MGNRYFYFLKEFLSFIRIENCFFAAGIAVSGYLIFNRLSILVLPLLFAMFFGTGASYAYNYLKDVREDLANKRSLNRFVLDGSKGRMLVASFYFLGFIASFFLSFYAWMTYLILMMLSVIYSGARIKERFLVKNIYTGFVISFALIIGAAANQPPSMAMVPYAAVVFVLGFAANILGDMRGREGDASIGMVTLPILFGLEKTRVALYALLSLLVASIMFLKHPVFYPIIPFAIMSMLFLWKNCMRLSRMAMLSSFVSLPLFMLVQMP